MKEVTKYFSNSGTRNEVRMRVIDAFSKEAAGSGKGSKASRYTYFVETLKSGNRVYLKRPANLHNGFDFLVCVENTNYASTGERYRNYPKQDDIIKDLMQKKQESKQMYNKLYLLIEKVYNCCDVADEEIKSISFKGGFLVDSIIKVIKWLFIEQDIRYWNYSGRGMLFSGIPVAK